MFDSYAIDIQCRALDLFMSRGADGFRLAFTGDDYFEVIETFETAADAFAARMAATEALHRLTTIAEMAA
jgi:hypothetical protein